MALMPYFFSQRTIFFSHSKQPTVFSIMAYQPSEHDTNLYLCGFLVDNMAGKEGYAVFGLHLLKLVI